MERVTFILHVSLTLLVVTAGAIFALAEGRTGIPAITIPVAIVACILVDHYRLWRLPTTIQNLLGLAAFAAAAFELYLSDIEAPLLSGGHLLSYLTCAFLLQPKGRRQFWWLAALSLLQVAVASVLTYDGWFGLTMPFFLLEMLWTMSVFQLQQAALTANDTRAPACQAVRPAGAQRWLGSSSASRTAQLDEQHRWVTPRFVLSMLTGTALSLMLTVAFFVFIPRVWPNTNAVFTDGGRPIGGAPSRTGYTSKITLGHVGEIQESSRIALESRLYDRATDSQMDWGEWLSAIGGDPRFRGVTQEVYDDGSWGRWEGAEGSHVGIAEIPVVAAGSVRQDIRIYHQSSRGEADIVMACGLPFKGVHNDPLRNLEIEPFSWSLASTRRRGAQRDVRYQLEVAPLDPWYPNPIGQIGPFQQWNRHGSRSYLWTSTRLPSGLRDQLESWIAERPELHPQSMSHSEIARQFEQWFLDGSEFTYSLNLSVTNPSVDPIIDFLANTRRGHCEYFASALALLLRTQGIPTRVVTGYKGGQFEPDGALTVRDLHAHLWVEAYLTDAPENAQTGQMGPRWVTLDPTPASRDTFVATQEQRTASAWGQLQSSWAGLWSQSIRMTESDQRALIFDPLQGIARDLWSDLKAVSTGQGGGIRQFLTSPRRWFSWQGGLFVFCLLLTATGVFRGILWLGRRRRHSVDAATDIGLIRVAVPFYDRFETLLLRCGLSRARSQTPREFSLSARSDLLDRMPPRRELESLPATIADRFYRVRYGEQSLPPAELADLDRQLDELERELETDALRRKP